MYGGLRAEGLGFTHSSPASVSKDVDIELPLSDPHRKVISFDEMMDRVREDLPSIARKLPGTSSTPSLNPKQGVGSQKLPMHLVSPLASAYMAVGLANGAGKYGAGNYKGTEILMSIYIAALIRHLYAFLEGEEIDEAEGVPHLAAILANVAIILDARAVGTLVDDRVIAGGYLKEIAKLTEIYQGLLKIHEKRNPFHFTRNNVDT